MHQMTQALSPAADCYIRMEQCYRASIQEVLTKRAALKNQLKNCRCHMAGTRESALEQKRMEQRIDLLTDEYYELCDDLRRISAYARKQETCQ